MPLVDRLQLVWWQLEPVMLVTLSCVLCVRCKAVLRRLMLYGRIAIQ